ncbi:MAG: hypothetical protein JXR70_18035 [Spirochaetales bacterium]|nr:hypothetical protein [Spirochaetales bacterium]
MEKQNFNYYQCSGDEFILINKETIYHHASGKKIAISVNKLKEIKISHKLIYIATENISTLFCPKYGVDELAKELLRYTPQKIKIEIEKGLEKYITLSLENTSSSDPTRSFTEDFKNQ